MTTKTSQDAVTIVITSIAERAGTQMLYRAVHSAETQTVEPADVMIVFDTRTPGRVHLGGVAPLPNDIGSPLGFADPGPINGVDVMRRWAAERASTRWILFLDDDDSLEPDAVEKLLARAIETGADVVVGGVTLVAQAVELHPGAVVDRIPASEDPDTVSCALMRRGIYTQIDPGTPSDQVVAAMSRAGAIADHVEGLVWRKTYHDKMTGGRPRASASAR